jgi:hypothetical protein
MTLNMDGRLRSINNPALMQFNDTLSTMQLTSYEHWLGNENAQLVDDIANCISNGERMTATNFKLQSRKESTFRYINYNIQRLTFDKKLDEIMQIKKSTTTNTKSPKNPPEKAEDTDKQSIEGILIVMDEKSSTEFMLEILAKQVKAPIMNTIKFDTELLEGAEKIITVLNIDIRGCI